MDERDDRVHLGKHPWGQTELARVSRTLLIVDNMTTQGGVYGQKLLRILTQVVVNYVCSRYIHASIAFY
jgi:hypothetical protein